jgi:hypothetical protein
VTTQNCTPWCTNALFERLVFAHMYEPYIIIIVQTHPPSPRRGRSEESINVVRNYSLLVTLCLHKIARTSVLIFSISVCAHVRAIYNHYRSNAPAPAQDGGKSDEESINVVRNYSLLVTLCLLKIARPSVMLFLNVWCLCTCTSHV